MDYPDQTPPPAISPYHDTLTYDEIPHSGVMTLAGYTDFMFKELAEDIKEHPENFPPKRMKHILDGTMGTGKFYYVKDADDEDFVSNYPQWVQQYAKDPDSLPLPYRAFLTVWYDGRDGDRPVVPSAPPGYTPFFDGGQGGTMRSCQSSACTIARADVYRSPHGP
jgi:hypothetical protein